MISSSELGNFFKYLKASNRNIFLKSPPNNLELMITCMFSLILNCKNNLLLPGSTKNWVQNDRKNFRNSNSFFKIFPLNEYPEQQNSIYYFEYFPLLQISLVCWKECPKFFFSFFTLSFIQTLKNKITSEYLRTNVTRSNFFIGVLLKNVCLIHLWTGFSSIFMHPENFYQ